MRSTLELRMNAHEVDAWVRVCVCVWMCAETQIKTIPFKCVAFYNTAMEKYSISFRKCRYSYLQNFD